jgi:HK97 gp10 family phage protein
MIDFTPLVEAVAEAAALGLGEGAEVVARSARAKAPVRRIFTNRGPKMRYKTAQEMEADKGIRKALGLSVEGSRDNPTPRIVASRLPPRRWHDRRLSQADKLLADREKVMDRMKSGRSSKTPARLRAFHAAQTPWRTALSARGAYEVKTRRAMSVTFGHRTIGGGLRDSITAEVATRSGGRSTAWVIVGAEYGKYQEFGTRHNAARPFLRPAAAESQPKVVEAVANRVSQAISQTNLGSFEIEIVVPL